MVLLNLRELEGICKKNPMWPTKSVTYRLYRLRNKILLGEQFPLNARIREMLDGSGEKLKNQGKNKMHCAYVGMFSEIVSKSVFMLYNEQNIYYVETRAQSWNSKVETALEILAPWCQGFNFVTVMFVAMIPKTIMNTREQNCLAVTYATLCIKRLIWS